MIAALGLFATPALADRGHKHKQHPKHHVVKRHPVHYRGPVPLPPRVVRAPRRVVVPTVIRASRVESYRPYYAGRVYYGPHGHDHDVYYFPVYRDHRYVWEAHHYCDGHRVSRGHVAYQGPNLSFRISF
jgi:hypothetical protein